MTKNPAKISATIPGRSPAKGGRAAQDERFVEAARELGGGASAEHFASLVSAIAKARLPKAANSAKPKKPKALIRQANAKKPKLIRLKYGR